MAGAATMASLEEPMATRRDRRAWRAEFESLGTRQVREEASVGMRRWGSLRKPAAGCGSRSAPYLRMTATTAAAAIGAIIGATIGAVLTAWLRC
jgi:hypothetical protein